MLKIFLVRNVFCQVFFQKILFTKNFSSVKWTFFCQIFSFLSKDFFLSKFFFFFFGKMFFVYPKSFYQNFCCIKIFVVSKFFFGQKLFLVKNLCGSNFLVQNFFCNYVFLSKIFFIKNFFWVKFFWAKSFLGVKNLFGVKFFLENEFFVKICLF